MGSQVKNPPSLVYLQSLLDTVYQAFPTHQVQLSTALPNASSGTTWELFGTWPFNNGRYTAATQDVYIEYAMLLRAGTHTFTFDGLKASDAGIATVSIDGSNLGTTIDLYNGSTAVIHSEITGVTVATSGLHLVRFTGATKNVSSSGYKMKMSAFGFTRTGA